MTATASLPTAELIGEWEPGTPDWHEARRDAVGGSEVAPILHLSPFESHFSLWHRKAGTVGPVEENPQMRWGKKLEDVICDEFAAQHPELSVIRAGTYRHVERHWQIANPDRLAFARDDVGECVVVEAKTARDDIGWGEPGTDQIPVYYRCQVLHYLDVLGLTVAFVPVLIAGSDYREYVVTYDEHEARIGREAAEAFIATVRQGRRPPIDSHDQTYRVVRELHPDIEDARVEISMQLASDFRDACAAVKTADEAKKLQTALVADAMGNARKAIDPMGDEVAIRISKNGGTPYVQATQTRSKK